MKNTFVQKSRLYNVWEIDSWHVLIVIKFDNPYNKLRQMLDYELVIVKRHTEKNISRNLKLVFTAIFLTRIPQ